MLNLPLAFKTSLETIPANIPYLYADEKLVTQWREKLSHDRTIKIGICWRGDAAHGAHKFMPIEYFKKLVAIPGITLYSLQKNDPASSLKPANQADNSAIVQFPDEFDTTNGRFMDTAAVMKNLDLIITVDTSIAHLAGGLGVPTWLVLPFPAEWRWLENRSDSPYYPSMRIFRQKKFGDWNDVYDQVVTALQDLLSL
jgi:ADP-heptose:LPS heptosyltransferase